jgi:two-component system heavy metal sensor histidine kinase CusS
VTRRIVLAILLVTWAVMIAGAVAIYWVTRETLLSELDQSLLARAAALPQLLGVAPAGGAVGIPPDDRYVIRNERGQTVARPQLRTPAAEPVILSRTFVTLGDGQRVRSITVRMPGREGDADTSYTVAYSGSAQRFDQLLRRLFWLLTGVCVVSGVLAPVVAVRTSRAALRPLQETAAVLAGIDDRTLNQRIDAAALPPELTPVALRLNQMLERLERGATQRKRFLADAAHELRTPIAAVLTSLEVALSRPRDAAAMTQILRDALNDVRLLKTLAEALLDQAKAEHDVKHQKPEPVDLGELCRQCGRLLESIAHEKQVDLSCSVPDDLTIQAQPQRLRSILVNLLSNAVEHTPPGGRVELAAAMASNGVTLSVADTGKGIAPEHLPHVFEPFYRADEARTSHSGHLGLGLFLVRTHAQAMGGTCTAESRPGHGSRFTITLPQPASPPTTLKPRLQPITENISA